MLYRPLKLLVLFALIATESSTFADEASTETVPAFFTTLAPLTFSTNTGTIQPVISAGFELTASWRATAFYTEARGAEIDTCRTNVAGTCSEKTFTSSDIVFKSGGVYAGYRILQWGNFDVFGEAGLAYLHYRETSTYAAPEGDVVYHASNDSPALFASLALEFSQAATRNFGLPERSIVGVQPMALILPSESVSSSITTPRSGNHQGDIDSSLDEELSERPRGSANVAGFMGSVYIGFRF